MEKRREVSETQQKMKQRKTISLGIILAVVTLFAISFVSAEFQMCFQKGEKIDYCNPKTPDRTAPQDGYQLCMSYYDETRGCYGQGDWNECNSGDVCNTVGGNTTLDAQAPEITLINPEQNEIYNKRSVPLSIELNEEGNLYYLDLVNGRGRWANICKDCISYSGQRSFKEGWNNLTIIAEDVVGNYGYKNISFFVDSKKPQIHKAEPRNGFVSTEFSIQYTEDNLAEVKIDYGNSATGMRSAILSGCASGKKQSCTIDLSLGDYENQQIEYWFTVKDIAGNSVSSKKTKLIVDTIFPAINEFVYNVAGKYLYLKFNVTELNFDSIEYKDNSEKKPAYKNICSRLKNGICEKKITLKASDISSHEINFQIMDKAGNAVSEVRTINII